MDKPRTHEKWYERLSRIINSTVCFSLAYIAITYLFWLIMGYAGKMYKFDSFVYYFGIKYILNDNVWTKQSITLIFSSGSILSLVIGITAFFLFERLKHIKVIFNVFLLWLFIIGTTIFAAQAVIAVLGANEFLSPFYQNLTVVYAWWHLPYAVVCLLVLPWLALFLFFAVNYAKPFLLTAYSYSKVNSESRRKSYFIETAVIPFILGSVITTAVTFPMNIFVHAVYLGMLGIAMLIGWLSLIYIKVSQDEIIRYKTLQQLDPIFLFLLLLAIFFVFIGWKGINLHVI